MTSQPEVTLQPEVVVPPEVTSQPEVVVPPEVTPQSPEVTSQPEVTARAEVKNCALLHNGITGLYICVACCTLRLVVMLWGDLNQRMRVE